MVKFDPLHLTVCFLIGLALASFWLIDWLIIFLLISLGLIILIIDRRSSMAVFFIGLALGAGYLNLQVEKRLAIQERWQAEAEVVLVGTVVTRPELRPTGAHLEVKLDWPVLARSPELRGHFTVFGDYAWAEFSPGQRLIVSGRPTISEEFQNYRLKEGVYATFFHPKVELIGRNNNYFIPYLASRVQDGASSLIDQRLAEPSASLLKAMLLGQRISNSSFSNHLSRTGLNHIAVVSGMHLVVLAGILRSLLKKLKFSQPGSAKLILVAILIFVLLTGGRPSIWRAGLMVGLGFLGPILGRLYQPGRAIIWAAFFILLANPLLLRWDIGFQLSFLAATGLICWFDQLKKWLSWVPVTLLRESLAVTLAAQLATIPLSAYYFQQLSLVGPLANIAVVIFLPLIFTLGLAFLLSAGFTPVAWLTGLVLAVITQMIVFFSGWGWSAIVLTVPVWFLVIYYFAWFLASLKNFQATSAFHAERLC
ncbi:MAG TPA: ComEC/Rec2 family competence protein [Candidatus Pacearchaeota archaeon]|nr:ComEC/Rec2 family competence protein [Candidatus Pacearchaeota archaeon]